MNAPSGGPDAAEPSERPEVDAEPPGLPGARRSQFPARPDGADPSGLPFAGKSQPPDGPDPSDGAPLGEPLAPVLSRLAARLFDAAIMLAAVLASIPLSRGGRIALLVVVPIVYETVMVATAGRTAGKMLVGIHVVRRADGGRPQWLPAFARSAPAGILAAGPVLAAVVMVLCFLPMVGDQRLQRSLQDRIARTVVVKRESRWNFRAALGRPRTDS